MKLYLHGHDYKYAAEQMLLVPNRSGAPAGAPSDFYVSPGGSESRPRQGFASGKTLARRRRRPICDGEASGYDSSSLSSASSEPLALLNSARSCSTVSFFFSSPAISTTIRPS